MLGLIIGRKLKQVQRFAEDGKRVPITEIEAGPCKVTQVKIAEKDGYNAIQIGFGTKKHPNKPLTGHIRKTSGEKEEEKKTETPFILKEIRLDKNRGSKNKSTQEEENSAPKVGDLILANGLFKAGDKINVSGTSKGKGFAGVVKRHHFKGGPKTHGQSDRHRAPGSIGQTTTPGRVYKGKRMAGHMGMERVTIKNLVVLDVDAEKNVIRVKGLVPGPRNGILEIKKTGESKNFKPLLK